MNSIVELREDLWTRWRKLLDVPVLGNLPAGARTVYSRVPLFDLKKWSPQKFPPGGRVSPTHIADDDYSYRLDEQGWPIAVSFRHAVNGIDWQGTYRYAPDEAEYVKYCVQTRVPSQYDRLTLRDGQLASFQRLIVNMGGAAPIWRRMARKQVLEQITSDSRMFGIWIEEYEAKDGVIRGGRAYTEGLGMPGRHSTLVYSYAPDGKLQRIVQKGDDGLEQTLFATRTKTSVKELSNRLSRRLAERIVRALEKAALPAPLVALELAYRVADSYVPGVIPYTEQDSISLLPLACAEYAHRAIQLDENDFQPALAEFMERITASENHRAGTKMLHDAAKLLNASLLIPRAEAFIAYAVDWEIESDQIAKILTECGADSKSVKAWKKRGWI